MTLVYLDQQVDIPIHTKRFTSSCLISTAKNLKLNLYKSMFPEIYKLPKALVNRHVLDKCEPSSVKSSRKME